MASPTEAEIQDQIGKVVENFFQMRQYGGVTASDNLLQTIDDVIAVLETDYAPEVTSGLAALRGSFAGTLELSATVLAPLFLEYGKFIGTAETDFPTIFTDLFDHFVDNTLRVTSRQFTYGTPAAGGGNVGDGVVNRLTEDADGFDIENTTADDKTVTCIADEHSGAPVDGEEIFVISGEPAERDRIVISGSGLTGELTGVTGRQTTSFVSNPSFGSFTGSVGSLTALTDWTPNSAIGNFDVNQTTTYRTYQGEGTATSLVINANDGVTQDLSTRRAQFDPTEPVYVQVAVNRNSTGCDGTFTINFGAVSTAVTLTTLGASGWNIIRIGLSSDNYFKNFNADPLDIELVVSGGATFGLLVDDVIVAPMTDFDNLWYNFVGGATPAARDDVYTWSDTEVGGTKLQEEFWRAFGLYLPHTTGGGVTWAEPT